MDQSRDKPDGRQDQTPQEDERGPFVFEETRAPEDTPYYIGAQEFWSWYADGYFRAAQILVDRLRQARIRRDVQDLIDPKILLYPILFLYRHWIELMLKAVLLDWARLRGGSRPKLEHKIMPLWKRCRQIMEELWPEGPQDELDTTEALLRQFSRADQWSTAFRYPEDTKGNASLNGVKITGWAELHDEMKKAYKLFYGVHAAILAELDALPEAQAYFADEFYAGP